MSGKVCSFNPGKKHNLCQSSRDDIPGNRHLGPVGQEKLFGLRKTLLDGSPPINQSTLHISSNTSLYIQGGILPSGTNNHSGLAVVTGGLSL